MPELVMVFEVEAELGRVREERDRVAAELSGPAQLDLEHAQERLDAAQITFDEAQALWFACHAAVNVGGDPMVITPQESLRNSGKDGGEFDRKMRSYEQAKLALASVRDEIYQPALVGRNSAAQRVSALKSRLRAVDGVIEQTEQRLAKARAAQEARQDPMSRLRAIRDQIMGGSAA